MKAIKNHIDNVKKEGDEMAWMMMISFFNRHYNNCFEPRKALLAKLKQNLPQEVPESKKLHELGEKLVNNQAENLEKLATIAKKHQKMANLYFKYDALKQKKQQVVGRLAAEKEQLKQTLALQIREE